MYSQNIRPSAMQRQHRAAQPAEEQSLRGWLSGRLRHRAGFRLFALTALLMGILLLAAENEIHYSYDLGSDDAYSDQVEGQIAQNQGNTIREIAYVVVLGIGVVCFKRIRDVKLYWRDPLAPLCGALLAWCALSTIWSEDPLLTVKRLLAYGFMLTGAAGITVLWSRRQIVQFVSVLGVTGVALGFLDELVFHGFQPWVGAYRFSGTQHENVQGFCCLLALMASLAAADMTPRRTLMFRGFAAFSGVFLLLTKSRSSFLGAAVALVLYFMLTRPSTAKFVWAGGLLLAGAALYITGVLNTIFGFVSRNGEGLETLTGRKPVWDLAGDFVQQHPWIGFGYQAFWSPDRIDYFSSSFGWQISSAHNGYLETLLGLGYIGVALHTAVLALGVVMGGVYFRRTGLQIYALASAMFAALLCVGLLESAELISPGPYGFGLTVLMVVLCFEPRFGTEPGEFAAQPAWPRQAGRRIAGRLVKV